MTRITRLLLAFALLTAAACENPGGSDERTPARLVVVSGDMQFDTVGKEVAQPLIVRVVDERGRPVRNQPVNFVVTSGGGSVFAGSAITNADGEARERWTLGTVAGDTQRVEARAMDASTDRALVVATFRAVGQADAPHAASVVGQAARAGTAGAAVADSLAVKVVDRHGNPVSGTPVSFAAAGGGSVSPASAATRADGTAKAQWTMGTSAGPQSASATVAGLPALAFTGTAGPGGVARVVLTPESATFSSLGETAPLAIAAFDAFGNPIGGQPVMLVSQNSAVVALDGLTARAAGNGSTRIVATAQGATAADTAVVTVRQVVDSVAVSPPQFTLVAGATQALAPAAFDARGNPVAGASFEFSASGPAVTVSPAGVVTAVSATREATVTVRSEGKSATAKVAVVAYLRVASVSASEYYACALDDEGRAYCWGFNGGGSLMTGTTSGPDLCRESTPRALCHATPVAVGGSLRFKQIEVGSSGTCALTAAGAAYCKGSDHRFAAVPGGLTFASLSRGDRSGCALTLAGEAYCGLSAAAAPERVAPGLAFTELAEGDAHRCGLGADGTAYCWGANADGQLGDGTTTARQTPAPVGGEVRFTSLTAGANYTCGISTGGAAYCWGGNFFGQLGSGFAGAKTPAPVAGGHSWRSLSADYWRTCGVTTAGQAFCWGALKFYSGPRLPDQSAVPAQVPGGHAFTTVESGGVYACGTDTAGRLLCWGQSDYGQLGTGTVDNHTPAFVMLR